MIYDYEEIIEIFSFIIFHNEPKSNKREINQEQRVVNENINFQN